MSEEHTRDEFVGNVQVTISKREVRVWVCDEKGCQFRFKAVGDVVNALDDHRRDVMVIGYDQDQEAIKALVKACEAIVAAADDGHYQYAFNEAEAALALAKKGK